MKSDADVAWDDIRREVQYRLNLTAAAWKARKLNEVLPELQEQFEDALSRGEILALNSPLTSGLLGELDTFAG